MYNYYVIEIQTNADGTSGHFLWGYADKVEAEGKYLAVRAACAISAVMVHTAMWVDNKGNTLEKKAYIHPVEPVQEPEE